MCLLGLLAVLAAGASAQYGQVLPDCGTLDRFWLTKARSELKPSWPAAHLACGKAEHQLTPEEVRDVAAARAAYVLHHTQWSDRRTFSRPLVAGGGIAAPPDSMLDWVGARIGRLIHDPKASHAGADWDRRTVTLPTGDFKLESGVGLAAQLIHESRHIGFPKYGHVDCTVPGQAGSNCDPTIAEDFDGGGSHAIAAIWLTWIARKSSWPAAARREAEDVVFWVLQNRINDADAAEDFACRYFGRSLPVSLARPRRWRPGLGPC